MDHEMPIANNTSASPTRRRRQVNRLNPRRRRARARRQEATVPAAEGTRSTPPAGLTGPSYPTDDPDELPPATGRQDSPEPETSPQTLELPELNLTLNEEDDECCPACLIEPLAATLHPCGHVLCATCPRHCQEGQTEQYANGPLRCPLCRTTTTHVTPPELDNLRPPRPGPWTSTRPRATSPVPVLADDQPTALQSALRQGQPLLPYPRSHYFLGYLINTNRPRINEALDQPRLPPLAYQPQEDHWTPEDHWT